MAMSGVWWGLSVITGRGDWRPLGRCWPGPPFNNLNQAAGRQREAVELVGTVLNEMVATANEVARS